MGVLDKLYEENDFDIVDEFIGQWDYIIDDIDIVIERLEKPEFYKESVNELFRIFHSLKSATAFLKLDRINILSKFVEDVLESARQKDVATDCFIDWMFLASGQIMKWYQEITHNKELSPIDGRLLKIPKGY
jgi:two-component system chemotaxis sensor kinase CheA